MSETFERLISQYEKIQHNHEPCNGCVQTDKEYEKLAAEYAYLEMMSDYTDIALEADIARLRARCQMIADIAVDRDGYVSAEYLGKLVDELAEWARGEHDEDLVEVRG